VNGICGCDLPACCCQPAVARGIIYADLRGELNTHLALQALFTWSSPVRQPLLQALPFSSTLGEVTLHLFSQACMFVYSSRGKWVFPPLLWSFPPSTTLTSFPTPGCCARAPAPARASLAHLACLFTVPGRIPSFQCVFVVLIAYYSISLFIPRWRLVCPGGYAALAQGRLWEYCGTTKLTLPVSSQAIWVGATGGLGSLLVSPLM
jgi:hypothetical protein